MDRPDDKKKMTKTQFMELMHFPVQWMELGMYTDELFHGQISEFVSGNENGSEHDRNGAFHWWLRKNPSKDQLKNLLRLAALDPDPLVGADVRSYIRKAPNFDDELAALDKEL